MTDKLHGVYNVEGVFTKGEQPSEKKFTVLHELAREAIRGIEKAVGPITGTGPLGTFGNGNNTTQPPVWQTPAGDIVGNQTPGLGLSVARLIGSAAVLNPTYVNSIHPRSTQTLGFDVPKGVLKWPLPYPASAQGLGFLHEFVNDTEGVYVDAKNTKEGVLLPGDYCVEDNVMYQAKPVVSGDTRIKYNIQLSQGDSYRGARWNVIPDPSILRLNDGQRTGATGSPTDYGCCRLSSISSTPSHITFRLELPSRVISSQYRKNSGTIGVSSSVVGDSDPIGLTTQKYELRSDLYGAVGAYRQGINIAPNTMALWDSATNLYLQNIEVALDGAEGTHVYRVVVPFADGSKILNDSGGPLYLSGINSKSVFLVVVGTQLNNLVSQLRATMLTHNHGGEFGERISHRDLLHTSWLTAGRTPGLVSGNFTHSAASDNVHPQYLNRSGYMYGGTGGTYFGSRGTPSNLYDDAILEDRNMVHGDLVMGPHESNKGGTIADPVTMKFEDRSHNITTLANSNSFALVFGIPGSYNTRLLSGPGQRDNYGWALGATRMYYGSKHAIDLPNNKICHTGIPLTDISETFAEGNFRRRGLSFNWGNIHINRVSGGLDVNSLIEPPNDTWHAGLSALFGEASIVVTGNGKSGQVNDTANMSWKSSKHRDGFSVVGVRGADINLKIGVPHSDISSISNSKPGAVSLEASRLLTDLAANSPYLSSGGSILVAGELLGGRLPWNRAEAPNTYESNWNKSQAYTAWAGTSASNAINGKGGVVSINALLHTRDNSTSFTRMGRRPKGSQAEPLGTVVVEATKAIDLVVRGRMRDGLDLTRKSPLLIYGSRSIDRTTSQNNPEPGSFMDRGYTPTPFSSADGLHNSFDEVGIWSTPLDINNELVLAPEPTEPEGYNKFSAGGNISLHHMTGQESRLKAGAVVNWDSARSYNYYSRDLGSWHGNLRKAATVEAFQGYRSDPHQPYVSTYYIPFKAGILLYDELGPQAAPGIQSDGVYNAAATINITLASFKAAVASNAAHGNWIFDLSSVDEETQRAWLRPDAPVIDMVGGGGPEASTRRQVTIDSLIRHHDDMISQESKYSGFRLGDSVLNYEVMLDTFQCVSASTNQEVDISSDALAPLEDWAKGIRDASVVMTRVTGLAAIDNERLTEGRRKAFIKTKGGPASYTQTDASPTVEYMECEYSTRLGFMTQGVAESDKWADYLQKCGPNIHNGTTGTGIASAMWCAFVDVNIPYDMLSKPGSYPFQLVKEGDEIWVYVSGAIKLELLNKDLGYGLSDASGRG